MNETEASLILHHTPGLGPITSRQLVQKAGSALAVLDQDPAFFESICRSPQTIHSSLLSTKELDTWKKDRDLAFQRGVEILPFTSPKFPSLLQKLPDGPFILYTLGSLQSKDREGIAIVGTRSASTYGREMAEELGRGLAEEGWTVVSGLALGVDTFAHKGALQRGRTLAVIGSGLANIYPKENWGLVEMIQNKGAILSEYPMITPPDRQNFPQRNRIVAGMTRGTLLIEAPLKSGAMITMDRAKKYERDLFAIPGRADWASFRGNHQWIKNGAKLVENSRDISQSYEDLFHLPVQPKRQNPPLNPEEASLLQHFSQEEIGIETLTELTDWPIHRLNILLMSLVLKKQIKEYPGRTYRKVGP